MQGTTNPLTVQSSVVVNAKYDRIFSQRRKEATSSTKVLMPSGQGSMSVSDDVFDIMPREIAMSLRSDFDVDLKRQPGQDRSRVRNCSGLFSFLCKLGNGSSIGHQVCP